MRDSAAYEENMIIDTHSHYDDAVFDEDRDTILNNLKSEGVELVVDVGADLKGCRSILNMIEKYDNVYGALGIHPDGITELVEQGIEDETVNWIKEECLKNSLNKIVAVGEIGLDYYYPDPVRDIQIEWFEKQLELAGEVKMPVIIHSREAAKDTYDIMKAHHADKLGGIVHCFSYSKEMAKNFIDMGFYIGIGGVLTFKNARKLIEVVEYIPMDTIVLETDCPYLAPVPVRGTRNYSANIRYVVEKISDIKGISVEDVIDITSKNACRVYNI